MDSNTISDLFRSEVVEARQTRLRGEVVLTRPVSSHLITLLLTAIMLFVAIWVGFGEYSRIESARGIVETNTATAKIIALRPGLLTTLKVRDGDSVTQGQTLAVIKVEQQYTADASVSEEGISALEAQQRYADTNIQMARDRASSEKSALYTAMQSTKRQASDVETQIQMQRDVLQSLESAMKRMMPIAARGFISQADIDRRKIEIISARKELSRLSQQATSLDAEIKRASSQVVQLEADSASQVASLKSTIEGLKLQRSRLKGEQTYILTAGISGVVTALQTSPGKIVDSNVPLMTIVPKDVELHVDLYAPSRAMGLVNIGQEVRILYDAFPFQRFGSQRGKIIGISRIAIDPRDIAASFKTEEPVYKVTVRPDAQTMSAFGQEVNLQPGMTLSANIILERRSFVDWLLEPMRAVMQRDR